MKATTDGTVTVSVKGNTNTVYQGVDPVTGEIKYIGITKNAPNIRWGQHKALGGAKSKLIYTEVRGLAGNGKLGRTAARVAEQNLINKFGLGGKHGGQLLNKINSIAQNKWAQFGVTF